MTSFDLSGKVALVTGGNGGIGRGIALGLAGAGADVAIAARNADKTARVVAEIEALGRRALALSCDVQDTGQIRAAVEHTGEALGGLDILVNNAGIAGGGLPQLIEEQVWDDVLATNLKAAFLFSKHAHALFKQRGGGKVINIGSEYGTFGSGLVLPYAVSKGGINQLTKSLAISWAADRIQVNTIVPGWIRTDMTRAVEQNDAFRASIAQRTPAGRFGEPEELAGTAVFLASAASDFVTGQTIAVDGGYSIA
jgi:2-deoxy-D-gluconate 3-dehydrogenase